MTNEPVGRPVNVIDPCLVCGVSTGTAGSYYSDRTAVPGPDGSDMYVCSDCRALARVSGKPTVDPNEPRGNLQIAIPTHTPLIH